MRINSYLILISSTCGTRLALRNTGKWYTPGMELDEIPQHRVVFSAIEGYTVPSIPLVFRKGKLLYEKTLQLFNKIVSPLDSCTRFVSFESRFYGTRVSQIRSNRQSLRKKPMCIYRKRRITTVSVADTIQRLFQLELL